MITINHRHRTAEVFAFVGTVVAVNSGLAPIVEDAGFG
jgi:hypothetical protein